MAGIFYPGGRAPSSSTGRKASIVSDSPFSTLANLETFSQNNPSELVNDVDAVSLAVVNSDPTPELNGTYEWSGDTGVYVPGKWVESQNLTALQVAQLYESVPGVKRFTTSNQQALESVSSIEAGQIPVSLGGGQYAPSGMRMLQDNSLLAPGNFGVESGSVAFGDILVLSESTGFLTINNSDSGGRFNVVDFFAPRNAQSNNPRILRLIEAENPFTPQPLFDTVVSTGDASFNYTTTLLARTNQVVFKINSNAANVRARVTAVASGKVLKYWPSKAQWLDGSGVTVSAGDLIVDFADTPMVLDQNFQLLIEVKGDNLEILGNSGVPYITFMLQRGQFENIPLERDLQQSDWNETDEQAITFIKNKPVILNRTKTITLTNSYTATAADFAGADHVFFRFNNQGQVDFIIPFNVVPNNITFSVKEVGAGGPTHRVLVQITDGLIDLSNDYLVQQDEAILIHKGISTNLDIIADHEPGTGTNNYVVGGSFNNNLLNLLRAGLSSVNVPLDLNDVNTNVNGLPINIPVSVVGDLATRQTIDLGSLSLSWSNLDGGKIGLRYYISTFRQVGYGADFRTLALNYGNGALVLNFDLTQGDIDGESLLEIQIPDDDYTSILNTNPVGTLVIDVRAASWDGQFQIREMYNRELSIIHNDVASIAEAVAIQEIGDLPQQIQNTLLRIQNNRDAINALSQMINSQSELIPEDVLSILINNIGVTNQTSSSLIPTPYNVTLSGDNTQAVFVDENQVSGTSLTSGPIKGDTVRGQKLLEAAQTYNDGDTIVHAYDGVSVSTPLVKRSGNDLVAIKFVPAISSGSYTETVRPTPSNQLAYDWYTVSGHTTNFSPESDELFFTRDVPTTPTTLAIKYRYFANGAAGTTVTATLANVGGSTNQHYQANLSLPNGGSFQIIIDYIASSGQIRYEAVPAASGSGLFIFDTQVSLAWTRTVTTPAVPATTEEVVIGQYTGNNVIAFRPSKVRVGGDNATMIVYGPRGEIDTGYSFNTLFGNTDDGNLSMLATSQTTGWYNYVKFLPNSTLLTEFSNRFNQSYNGWLTEQFTNTTVAELNVKLKVQALQIGNYELTINQTDGQLITSEIN